METTYDLLLVNGTVVTGSGVSRSDIGINGEIITSIESDLSHHNAREIINVSNKYIFPGVIDVHVHPVYLDNVQDCSRIAAYGGTTTLLHFAYARPGESLLHEVRSMRDDGLANSHLDFGLHGGIFDAESQLSEISAVMDLGVKTIKFFMLYLKQQWHTNDYFLLQGMHKLSELGGMAMIHCENGGGIDFLEDKYLTAPNASAQLFNLTRPDALEEEAVFRAIRLAEVANCPLYIVHMTAARALRHINEARQLGQQVYAETCPQYLTLTKEIIERVGALAKIGPPIRDAVDREALWEALANDTIQIVSTDHAPKKKDPSGNFLEQPFGSPQIETLLPLIYDGGVNQGKLSVVRMVQVLCENPARIFGLYPKKGTISVGSDADLVVFDPTQRYTLRTENQHSNAKYTLYEGHSLLGWPVMSFQRGRHVLWEGEIVSQPGKGEFLPTNPA